ncbi:MAG: hypothetical protein JW750_10965, partial [Anaerolineaceae bacterium]|nr:hypothetical protein [Anaerolineaceae bacterium]
QSGFEAEELDLDTMLDTGILIIEWPERIVDVLPPERLWVELEYISDEKRRFVFKPAGKYYEDMVEQFARVAFGGRI